MSAGNYKMLCEQGATFSLVITWKDAAGANVNMTGFTAKMQVRKSKTSDDDVMTLSTANGGIELGANGQIVLLADATETAALKEGQYVYDLEINTGSSVIRLIEGAFVVNGEVTR